MKIKSVEKPLLVIPVETRVRELDAKLLLTLVALKYDFDVIVGAMGKLHYLIDLIDRGIYLDKSIARAKKEWFENCTKRGFKIAALDEEGLVYFDADTYRQLRVYPKSMEMVDCFLAWGDDQVEVMTPSIGTLSTNVKKTGNARFDLLRPELRPFYQNEVEELQQEYGKNILINTNFSFFNSPERSLEDAFALCPIHEENPDFFSDWQAVQGRVMKSFLEMLPEIRSRFPDHTIIIRPHPTENMKPWQEIADTLSNTVVRREGNVVPWILASDVLVHWNCTTAIEAYLLGVPAIAYRKENSAFHEQPVPNAASFHAFNLGELLEKMGLAIGKKLTDPADESEKKILKLKHHITALDGEFAAERIVKELLPLCPSIERKRSFPERNIQNLKRAWRRILDLKEPSRKIQDQYAAGKFPDTNEDEIYVILSRLASCLQYDMKFNVKQVDLNCFSVSKTSL